jgi:hypothetical protein
LAEDRFAFDQTTSALLEAHSDPQTAQNKLVALQIQTVSQDGPG